MKQNIREISHRYFATFPFLTFGFIFFSVIALRFAHTSYAKPNPYLPYLGYTPDFIHSLTATTCYGDPQETYVYNSCTVRNEDVFATFVFLNTGQVRSVSFWEEKQPTYVGDFVAWYGVPNTVYRTRRWTSYIWYLSEFRLLVQSREDDMYSAAMLVVYGFQ